MTDLLAMDGPRKHVAATLSGLDIRYEMGTGGDGHPLLGRRLPDLDLVTAQGPTRASSLLHDARPVLISLGGAHSFDVAVLGGRARFVDAQLVGTIELPVVGEVIALPAVLIRPDGHVAWVGDLADRDLLRALSTWF